MRVAVPVDSVTRADVDSIRFDDLSFLTRHGRVGVTLFMPSVLQVTEEGEPDLVVPYSAGWGEGRGAAELACQSLAREGNLMAASIEYPPTRLRMHEVVPFRTEILTDVIDQLRSGPYGDLRIVVQGYSRGTGPARHAAVQRADHISGLSLVAPTWFSDQVHPRELATRGIAEGARGIIRENWVDKWGLLTAGARLAQEMLAHPIALRNDVAAISQEGAGDLREVLASGLRLGVVAGLHDELCEVVGIRRVLDELTPAEAARVDYREADSDHFTYFWKPDPLRTVVAQVLGLGAAGA